MQRSTGACRGVSLVTAEVPRADRLPVRTKLYYGLGASAFGVQDQGLRAFLLIFYSQVVGLNAAIVASVLMISTLVDAFIDPFIGQWSDNFRSRWGRRHPFMFAAAVPSSILFALLWFPPESFSDAQKTAWLAATTISLRMVMSFYEIPNIAQAPELTSDYHERTGLLSYRYAFFFLTGAGLTLLTYSVLMKPSASYPIAQLNPASYQTYALVAASVMAFAMLVSAWGTRDRMVNTSEAVSRHASLSSLLREMGQTFSNRPFLYVTGAGVLKSMALGASGALAIYINTYYWQLSARQISILVIDGTIAALLASAITRPVSQRFGKKWTAISFYFLSYLIAVIPVALRWLGLFVDNGSAELVPILFVVGLVYGTLGIGATITTSSMISDVVENSELKTGRRSEGLIFSATNMVQKAISGLGTFAAGLIIAAIDFPKATDPSGVPPEKIAALAIYVPVVGVFYVLGSLLLMRYPIDKKMHDHTLAQLEERRATISEVEDAQAGQLAT